MDLAICKCGKTTVLDPSLHTERCPYRLRYDRIVVSVELPDEALVSLRMAIQLLFRSESLPPEVEQHVRAFEQSLKKAVEAVNNIRMGAEMPTEESHAEAIEGTEHDTGNRGTGA